MVDEPNAIVGLLSHQALQKLHKAVEHEIQQFQNDLQQSQTLLSNLGQPLGLRLSHRSPLHWLSALLILLAAALMIVAYGSSGNELYIAEALILLVLLMINVYATGWDYSLQRNEMIRRGELLLDYISDCIDQGVKWTASSYPSLHSPFTKSFSLIWTYRDGRLVNLPSALLVEGDRVMIRPGQVAPAKVRHIEETELILNVGDRFEAESSKLSSPTLPVARKPLKANCFQVLETPYLKNLRVALHQSQNRPVSVLENKRIMCTRLVERILLPIIFVISLLTNIGRYLGLTEDVGEWPEMILAIPINTVIPLLPLFFPMCWIVVNSFGVARIVAVFNKALQKEERHAISDELETEKAITSDDSLPWNEVWEHFKAIICGSSSYLPRTSNLFHALGSMTVFSCVDKRGILSQPDPSVERVFFLTGLQPDDASTTDSVFTASEDHSKTEQTDVDENEQGIQVVKKPIMQDANGEILGLSANLNSDSKEVQFDEPDWEKHINSLKPMGLNILLNTCNKQTVEHHSQFIDHVYCAGNLKENPLYIQQQSCLCQLARLIGFTDRATDSYKLQHQLAAYRPIQKLQPERGRIQRVQTFIKRKTPIPHMMSVIVEDTRTEMQQLLTQGTADFVLDACTDFWDGSDICPIFENHRKKILDFYQRQCLASYCWAFSYRPMVHSIANYLEQCFIELPKRSKQGQPVVEYESPHVSRASWNGSRYDLDVNDGSERPYHSLDSAMNAVGDIRDAEGCYKAQCGQIFIGMVSCNYQAKSDIVNLLENLDEACIRFVHFSRDQELRSKVFSEKIGLETGWNCHISLLSEDPTSNQVSQQASESSSKPEHIKVNVETGQVTFHGQEEFTEDDVGRTGPDGESEDNVNQSIIEIEVTEHQDNDTGDFLDTDGKESPKDSSKVRDSDSIADATSERSALLPQPLTQENLAIQGHASQGDVSGESETTGLLTAKTSTCHGEQKHVRLPTLSSAHSLDSVSLNQERQRHFSETFSDTDADTESVTDPGSTGFDIFNRAKLPRGIQNIRPHLDQVDNVPLLVPLFTDVTPETTREMLQIMQEYGEVVCCIGSSLNVSNTEIFMQANASLALDPLLPSTCSGRPAHQSLLRTKYSPLDVTRQLASLPCCLTFHTDDNVRLTKLIKEARGFSSAIYTTEIFLIFCLVSLSMLYLLSSLLMLPPPLTGGQLLWVVIIIIPMLSHSLLACPVDKQIMTQAVGKNNRHKDWEVIIIYIIFFVVKFLSSVGICLLCEAITLNEFCLMNAENSGSCHFLLGNRNNSEPFNGLNDELSNGYLLTQNLVAFFLVLYFVVASASFAHRFKSLVKKRPFGNKIWCVVIVLVLVLQVIYFGLDVLIWWKTDELQFSLYDVPMSVWLIALLWPLVLLPLCEAIKFHDIQ
ncbi:transmembrane protein 94-like isoform X1 [Anneissia japonica]|uniref:transmembrane protein 94-like isoform X1 n=1 Tax=Anneissia japonica TaxID=1529436 RepID=UPI0014259184|nr:transmembrane protein 94-like isoform X1 [Anneissia japonica]XP_033095290.1 transmembrane protein 94-like isoform X1 [Anneissia japonica]